MSDKTKSINKKRKFDDILSEFPSYEKFQKLENRRNKSYQSKIDRYAKALLEKILSATKEGKKKLTNTDVLELSYEEASKFYDHVFDDIVEIHLPKINYDGYVDFCDAENDELPTLHFYPKKPENKK